MKCYQNHSAFKKQLLFIRWYTHYKIRLMLQKLEILGSPSHPIVHIQVKQRQFEAIIFKLAAQKWLITTTIFKTLLENYLLDRQSKSSHIRHFSSEF